MFIFGLGPGNIKVLSICKIKIAGGRAVAVDPRLHLLEAGLEHHISNLHFCTKRAVIHKR